MKTVGSPQQKQKSVLRFFGQAFHLPMSYVQTYNQIADQWDPDDPEAPALKMSSAFSPINQPEFWADAPWRLEPDHTDLPITLYIRDADIISPGYAPWRLNVILIEQRQSARKWVKLRTLIPTDLSGMDAEGNLHCNMWTAQVMLPLQDLKPAGRGDTVHLRITFNGSPQPYEETRIIERHIEIFLSQHALPLSRAALPSGPRHWFYGDTHYHSAYTDDFKEYGAPLPATRQAAQALGLDWIAVTDHSCDLDEIDPGNGGKTRWQRLKAELPGPQGSLSDKQFRFLLGEEVTLIGTGECYVHMLAFGNLQELIPGAFMPNDSQNWDIALIYKTFQLILKCSQGYPPNLAQRLFGKLYTFDEVQNMLPEGVLTFAAHPYDAAQIPPDEWHLDDLSDLRLTGHEFWNTRSRRKSGLAANPFSEPGWKDAAKMAAQDAKRLDKLMERAGLWDQHLQRGVEEWSESEPLPRRRPVCIAGSDAHGDFNYHAGMAWDYSKAGMIDDNTLGRARTAIYLPEHADNTVPEVDRILAALKKGSCVVTDGPILEFHLSSAGQVAHMGEMLQVAQGDQPEMDITVHTTPEFGPATQIEIITYFKDQAHKGPIHTMIAPQSRQAGKASAIFLDGSQGYCRLQFQTTAPSGERFCCLTNPIWVRLDAGAGKTLHIHFSAAA